MWRNSIYEPGRGEYVFKCDHCGLCCMNISGSQLYEDLDRGDGICVHLDCETKLCSIYEDRPIKCDVDRLYDTYFYQLMKREDYYQYNYMACKMLKEGESKECI